MIVNYRDMYRWKELLGTPSTFLGSETCVQPVFPIDLKHEGQQRETHLTENKHQLNNCSSTHWFTYRSFQKESHDNHALL